MQCRDTKPYGTLCHKKTLQEAKNPRKHTMHPRNITLLTILLVMVASTAANFSMPAHADAVAAPRHHHAASCLPQERDALLAFKRSITHDPAGRLASWQEGKGDCCRWRGVRCSNQTGHVLGLHLRNVIRNVYRDDPRPTLLSGHISPSLLYLQRLEYLDLSMNNIFWACRSCSRVFGQLNQLEVPQSLQHAILRESASSIGQSLKDELP